MRRFAGCFTLSDVLCDLSGAEHLVLLQGGTIL